MKILLSMLLFVVLIGCNEKVENKDAKDEFEKVDAVQMEKDLWANFGNIEYVEKRINEAFQSSHQDGARSRSEELELIKNLHLGEYQLTDFKATQYENVAVVTYFISVSEEIDGKVLPTSPAQRMSVWVKGDSLWQWIGHANLNPIDTKKEEDVK